MKRLDDTEGLATTFLLRFHGVRGSHPVAHERVLYFGGNTSCVEVECGGRCLILDCGTGAIALGRRLMVEAGGAGVEALLLFSHAHHDHTMGFPFFVPAYDSKSRLHLRGPGLVGRSFQDILEGAFADPLFPVEPQAMPSQRTYATLDHGDVLAWESGEEAPQALEGEADLSAVVVRCFRNMQHPNGGVLNYRIEHAGRSVVLATDVEGTDGVAGDLVEFARGTDLLIHDAQYTDEEYDSQRRGWGHSTWRMAADVAWRAQVRRLVLFHHDPEHDDGAVEAIERAAREKFPRCVAACEGLEIRL